MEVQVKQNKFYCNVVHDFMDDKDCLTCIYHCIRNKSKNRDGKSRL